MSDRTAMLMECAPPFAVLMASHRLEVVVFKNCMSGVFLSLVYRLVFAWDATTDGLGVLAEHAFKRDVVAAVDGDPHARVEINEGLLGGEATLNEAGEVPFVHNVSRLSANPRVVNRADLTQIIIRIGFF